MLFFGKNPKGMILSSGVSMTCMSRISWGKYTKIGKNVKLSGLGKEGITLGDNVSIGDYSQVIVATTLQDIGLGIKIGNNVGMGEFGYLGGAGGCAIAERLCAGSNRRKSCKSLASQINRASPVRRNYFPSRQGKLSLG